jgi:membrane fusion protein, multidrug efflux system
MDSHSVAQRCFLLALCAITIAACSKKEAPPAPVAPEVGVVSVTPQSVTVSSELPGRTSAYLIAQVRARVDGIVQKRLFKEGSDVTAGQQLFEIDPAPYRATLASARASLQKAEANLAATTAQAERYKILVSGNAVSKQDYDNAVASEGQANADVATGKAFVETASINLGYTNVTAPISGRIGQADVTEGAYVQAAAATLLATIQKIDPIYVDLNQSSLDGLRLRREVASGRLQLSGPNIAKVALTLEDGSTYPVVGKLEFTDITVDQGTGSVTLRAVFPNPNHTLLPGMFVHATIDEGTNQQALLVPQVGVTHDQQGKATVLVVGPDNKIELRPVVTGQTYGAFWEIQSGLKAGERVVVEGVQKIQPGQTVKPVAAANATGRSVSAGIVTGPAAQEQSSAAGADSSAH